MALPTTVKFFHSGIPGAPSINDAAGKGIVLLDACLLDGFANEQVTSITQAAGVATIFNGNIPWPKWSVIEISGANEPAYNGQFRLTAVTGISATFEIDPGAPVTATGSINVKLAPAGWTKPFTGTNLAAYRPPSGNRHFLRVADTTLAYFNTTAYQNMTDINTGTGLYPTTGTVKWGKAPTVTVKDWIIVADDKRIYYFFHSGSSYSVHQKLSSFFGDFKSYITGDANNSALFGLANNVSWNITTPGTTYMFPSIYYFSGYVAKSWDGVTDGVPLWLTAPFCQQVFGNCSTSGSPNPVANGIQFDNGPQISENGGYGPARGNLPAVYQALVNQASYMATFNVIEGLVPTPPGVYGVLAVIGVRSMNIDGSMTIDLIGPW